MRRHRFDPIAFVFGAAFIAVSATLASSHFAFPVLRLRWLGALFLLAFGVALLITSTRRGRDRKP